MEKFHDLFFDLVPIPPELKEDLTEFEYISKDGTTCCQYLLLLAKTCQVSIEKIVGMRLFFPPR